MYRWRISKFNPKERDESGAYIHDEWTSSSDIGRVFEGRILLLDEYLRVETAYVEAAKSFFDESNLHSLFIYGLEANWSHTAEHVLPGLDDMLQGPELVEGQRIDRRTLDRICKLVLREFVWCKLEDEHGRFYIHFGYDYYMYVGSHKPSPYSIARARGLGLFVENMEGCSLG